MGFERITPGDTMNKNNLAIAVLAAIGLGLPIGSAIQHAASKNAVSTEEVSQASRDAIVDAAVVLKGLRTKEQTKQQIAADSGVPRTSIDPLVEAVHGQANRSTRSRHNTPMAIICTQANLSRCLDAWARSYCEPLRGTNEPAIYRECVTVNSVDNQGAQYCTPGTQTRVLRVLKLHATDPMVERSIRNQGQFEVQYEPALVQRLAAVELCVDPTSMP